MTIERQTTKFSIEFFPPRSDEARMKFERARDDLALLNPHFFSVTFGAGGSTREQTLETVTDIIAATGIEAAPHLSCVGYPLAKIREVLLGYKAKPIRRIFAVCG